MFCTEHGIKNDDVYEVCYIFTGYVVTFIQYVIVILT